MTETENVAAELKRKAADLMILHEECGGNELRAIWEEGVLVGVRCPEHGVMDLEKK